MARRNQYMPWAAAMHGLRQDAEVWEAAESQALSPQQVVGDVIRKAVSRGIEEGTGRVLADNRTLLAILVGSIVVTAVCSVVITVAVVSK